MAISSTLSSGVRRRTRDTVVSLSLSLEIKNVDYSEIFCMVKQHNFFVDVDYYYNHFEYSRNFVNLKDIYEKFISWIIFEHEI